MTDLIAWCEDWAKSRGYWVQNSAHRRKGWCVRAIDAAHLPPGFQVCRGGDDGFDGWTTLTPLQFWLWAHAVDTGRTDSQRCPDCEGSKVQTERSEQHWARAPGFNSLWAEEYERKGWRVVWESFEHFEHGTRRRWRAERPLPHMHEARRRVRAVRRVRRGCNPGPPLHARRLPEVLWATIAHRGPPEPNPAPGHHPRQVPRLHRAPAGPGGLRGDAAGVPRL